MIEKNKKYTYEEIEEIFMKAEMKTLNELQEQWKEVKDSNDVTNILFSMQNMVAIVTLQHTLFGGK